MDKLSELLSVLKEKGLNKSYDRIIKDLNNLCNSFDSVKEEVNDVILNLVSEGKYTELDSVSYIPGLSDIVREEIVRIIENKSVSEYTSDTDNVKKEDIQIDKDKKDNEEISEYSGIITSVKGLQKGAYIVHKSFGKGKVVDIEYKEDGQMGILNVEFEDKVRRFSCTSEILEKYFGLSETIKGVEEEKGYNLYTDLEFFTSKKPCKIKILDKVFYCNNWRKAAVILFRELYNKNKDVFLNGMAENAYFAKGEENASSFRGSLLIVDDIYFDGHKSSVDILRAMIKMSEKYFGVYQKDVRRNVEIYLR